jgi:hypothetical protein
MRDIGDILQHLPNPALTRVRLLALACDQGKCTLHRKPSKWIMLIGANGPCIALRCACVQMLSFASDACFTVTALYPGLVRYTWYVDDPES